MAVLNLSVEYFCLDIDLTLSTPAKKPNKLVSILIHVAIDLIALMPRLRCMNKKLNIGLYWFRHDLRLSDNRTFNKLCSQVDRLICVYINGQEKELRSRLCEGETGEFKHNFEQQSVIVLDTSLRQKNQYLLFVDAPAHQALVDLIEEHDITHMGAEEYPGLHESKALEAIKKASPQVTFITDSSHTLFNKRDLPFKLENLPETFTPFRKRVENISIDAPIAALTVLPSSIEPIPEAPSALATIGDAQGGETAGNAQLDHYLFGTDFIKTYKQTRNELDDWDSSSKLSMWLANGCLSARTAYHAIKQYEAQRGENESTYWLYFELLWREYYQWYLAKHQDKLFQFSGVKQTTPSTKFNQLAFVGWCEGRTKYPIINACMRQLNQTGYMSNRGRQLVASCFVHELNLDWRYGAAYFEQQLIDHDVASNWGNWQYLAGVGADPHSHRKFNLAKQTATYDPDAVFRNKWLR
jgi:deoxyribodipyrimidine photo-lyase